MNHRRFIRLGELLDRLSVFNVDQRWASTGLSACVGRAILAVGRATVALERHRPIMEVGTCEGSLDSSES